MTRMFQQIRRGSGKLDMLVNNAAVLDDHLLGIMSDEQWHDVISTNLDGLFYCTREAVRLMIRHKSGRIVNMSRGSGISGNARQCKYAASKAAVIAFTRSLALEVGSRIFV